MVTDVTSLDGWVGWPQERLARAIDERQAAQLDALVMLDCRPAERRLDLVVMAGTNRVATAEPQRLAIRHTEVTSSVVRLAGTVAAAWQQRGFLPFYEGSERSGRPSSSLSRGAEPQAEPWSM